MNSLIVKPLGTVSPYCKDDKNCPGFLIKYGKYNILIDCGNGSTRLLNMEEDLNNLTIIISHLHPDHYGDLISLLQGIYVYRKYGLLKTNIDLFIPGLEQDLLDYQFIKKYADIAKVNFNGYSSIERNIGNIKVSTLEVPHQVKSYSIKIETPDGIVVYSGDTGSMNNLRDFVKGCNLFICESTYLKDQPRDTDNHLYAHEAAKIAKDAGVEKLMLTHFWPEIDKQKYVEEAKEVFNETEAANEGQEYVLRRK